LQFLRESVRLSDKDCLIFFGLLQQPPCGSSARIASLYAGHHLALSLYVLSSNGEVTIELREVLFKSPSVHVRHRRL
jgi:hypothetical protein